MSAFAKAHWALVVKYKEEGGPRKGGSKQIDIPEAQYTFQLRPPYVTTVPKLTGPITS